MNFQEIYQQFATNVKDTHWQEWVSTVAQITSVWYARKNNVLVYQTGIIGVLLAAYVYFFMIQPPLYADGMLNIYYFIMSIYGWYNWMLKKDATHYTFPISWCSKKELSIGVGLFLLAWFFIYWALTKTNSNTVVLDSLVAASAVVSMWWMAKRKIENWLAWIASNLVAIPLNFYKGLILFTLMYILFLLMAWWGYKEWKTKLSNESN